jgi:hydrogenase maturation protease
VGRTLIAGFGNVLRGDDGFGVAVLHRLAESGVPDGVELLEVGTGGIRLAQELLTGYERLVIVDAMTRGGRPGSLYVLAVESIEPPTEVDLHLAVPSRALALARALGALPACVFMIGCEPSEVDELTMEMTAPVRDAVEPALARVRELLSASALAVPAGPG